jgi:hypothetical protein
VRLEGLDKLKNPMTSSRFEPAIFRLVAYCLNQVCYHVPHGEDTDSHKLSLIERKEK